VTSHLKDYLLRNFEVFVSSKATKLLIDGITVTGSDHAMSLQFLSVSLSVLNVLNGVKRLNDLNVLNAFRRKVSDVSGQKSQRID